MAFLDNGDDPLPLVARYVPADHASGIREIWADRERLLGIVESAPPTLCHLDMHPANVFFRWRRDRPHRLGLRRSRRPR